MMKGSAERVDHSQYLIYLCEYKLLVCRSCKHCLQSNGIPSHLVKKHKVIPLSTRKELIKYAQGLLLYDSKQVITLTSPLPAFECLEIINGFECLICNSLRGTLDSMKEHCKTHDWKTSNGTTLLNDLMY